MKEIDDLIQEHIGRVNEAIEQACELALQTGGGGVLVVYRRDGTVNVTVTHNVPYGQIHERAARGG